MGILWAHTGAIGCIAITADSNHKHMAYFKMEAAEQSMIKEAFDKKRTTKEPVK